MYRTELQDIGPSVGPLFLALINITMSALTGLCGEAVLASNITHQELTGYGSSLRKKPF